MSDKLGLANGSSDRDRDRAIMANGESGGKRDRDGGSPAPSEMPQREARGGGRGDKEWRAFSSVFSRFEGTGAYTSRHPTATHGAVLVL